MFFETNPFGDDIYFENEPLEDDVDFETNPFGDDIYFENEPLEDDVDFESNPFGEDMFFESNSFGFGEAMFTIVPILIIGFLIFIVVKGLSEWNSNNNSPRLTVPALVATKRTNTSHGHHANDHMHSSSTTSYYVTFQFESGDRTEFSLSGSQYGMLAEGDTGMLTFQGKRYLGFERKRNED